MKSVFERMGGTYRPEGNYFVPNLDLPDIDHRPLGKYGRLRKHYLEEHRPGLYSTLLLSGKLKEHLLEIDQTCHERMERICSAMAEREGVTEALKAADQLEWVRRMNGNHSYAEEIVLAELVYAEEGGSR